MLVEVPLDDGGRGDGRGGEGGDEVLGKSTGGSRCLKGGGGGGLRWLFD